MCVVAKRNFEYPKSLFQSTANFSSFEGGKLKSNHQFSKRLLFVILLGLVFCLTVNGEIQAQSDSLILEVEQHWDTYGVGGTCIGGGHNLAVADVDEDGVRHLVMLLLRYGTGTDRTSHLKRATTGQGISIACMRAMLTATEKPK